MKKLIELINEGNALEATNIVTQQLKGKVKSRINEEKWKVAQQWLGEDDSLAKAIRESSAVNQYKSAGENGEGHLYKHPHGFDLLIKKQTTTPSRVKWVHRPGDKDATEGSGVQSLITHLNKFHSIN